MHEEKKVEQRMFQRKSSSLYSDPTDGNIKYLDFIPAHKFISIFLNVSSCLNVIEATDIMTHMTANRNFVRFAHS